MSWLFGKKKHQKDSPPDSTEEEQPTDQSEEFIFVEKRPAPLPPTPAAGDGAPYPSGGLYPYIGPVPTYPATLPTNLRNENQGEAVNYLSGVPFKLCKRLESNMNNDLDIDSLRISEILSFLERIESQNYEYDFSLEESVIAEMNSSRSDE